METAVAGIMLVIVMIIITGYTMYMHPEETPLILLVDLVAILQFINESIR